MSRFSPLEIRSVLGMAIFVNTSSRTEMRASCCWNSSTRTLLVLIDPTEQTSSRKTQGRIKDTDAEGGTGWSALAERNKEKGHPGKDFRQVILPRTMSPPPGRFFPCRHNTMPAFEMYLVTRPTLPKMQSMRIPRSALGCGARTFFFLSSFPMNFGSHGTRTLLDFVFCCVFFVLLLFLFFSFSSPRHSPCPSSLLISGSFWLLDSILSALNACMLKWFLGCSLITEVRHQTLFPKYRPLRYVWTP